jgi:hypothetical protein
MTPNAHATASAPRAGKNQTSLAMVKLTHDVDLSVEVRFPPHRGRWEGLLAVRNTLETIHA